jgi:hypothetical protein
MLGAGKRPNTPESEGVARAGTAGAIAARKWDHTAVTRCIGEGRRTSHLTAGSHCRHSNHAPHNSHRPKALSKQRPSARLRRANQMPVKFSIYITIQIDKSVADDTSWFSLRTRRFHERPTGLQELIK